MANMSGTGDILGKRKTKQNNYYKHEKIGDIQDYKINMEITYQKKIGKMYWIYNLECCNIDKGREGLETDAIT